MVELKYHVFYDLGFKEKVLIRSTLILPILVSMIN